MDIKKIIKEFINKDMEEVFQNISQLENQTIYKNARNALKLCKDGRYVTAATTCQVLLDQTWQELNIGHWKDVNINWRYLYTYVSILKAISICELFDLKNALKACDMGLLMGAPIFDNYLATLASEISTSIQVKEQFSDDTVFPLNDHKLTTPPTKKVKQNICSINKEYEIPRISCPSLITFQIEYMQKDHPVIIVDATEHWPCFNERKWTTKYIGDIAGQRTVPIEVGERYTSEDWTQKLLTVQEFIDTYITTNDSSGYLAQHQLFDQIPELKEDIYIPDYCYASETEEEFLSLNAWFGPKGTVSPLHHDPYHNLLTQVVGEKYIRLYAFTETDHLYPHEGLLDNTSQVDVENCDMNQFPKFLEASYSECILKEGEMLYIPPKCWHYIRSLSVSFSVSFWWK